MVAFLRIVGFLFLAASVVSLVTKDWGSAPVVVNFAGFLDTIILAVAGIGWLVMAKKRESRDGR